MSAENIGRPAPSTVYFSAIPGSPEYNRVMGDPNLAIGRLESERDAEWYRDLLAKGGFETYSICCRCGGPIEVGRHVLCKRCEPDGEYTEEEK